MNTYNVCVKTAVAAAIAATVTFLGMGCGDKKEPAGPVVPGSGVSFESYTGANRSILVDNNSSKNLVAFKGEVRPDRLISGIPAFAAGHGLKKEGALFNTAGDFPLVLVTEEGYIENKDNLMAAPVFATLYAYYNAVGDNDHVFKISGRSGGTGMIIIDNYTRCNAVIKLGSPGGEELGYVGGSTTNVALWLETPGEYDLFPVVAYYSTADNTIYTATGTMQSFSLFGGGPLMWDLTGDIASACGDLLN